MSVRKGQRQAIAKRLRELRGTATQGEWAKRTGVSQQRVSAHENGVLPSTESLIAMAEKTGVSVDWILFGTGTR